MEERFVPLAEVRDILKRIQKERGELTYEQRIALKHAVAFAKLPLEKVRDLMKELSENIEKLEERHVCKIADLLPTHEDDLKTIFAKERIALSEDEMKKILEIVSKYLE